MISLLLKFVQNHHLKNPFKNAIIIIQRVAFNCVSPVVAARLYFMWRYFMTQLDTIKKKISSLFSTSPKIHINVNLYHPRLVLKNDIVEIKGV